MYCKECFYLFSYHIFYNVKFFEVVNFFLNESLTKVFFFNGDDHKGDEMS